ncbi:hypothetical protein [Burkholderia multivorans]|uniref:hypothetical protein n=1 Tax=Burkholderia multivorans TaxID=87883 RepID=UPI0021C05F2D|nr:hypothetical protein [Burkholderia multivorans]
MATGDQNDIQGRIARFIPISWFESSHAIRDAIAAGLANAHAYVYSFIEYVRLQTRILTATDGFLDAIAQDFFGSALMRSANQSDASFRARILINIFRERATRKAITKVLEDLTGRTPIIIEPQRPADTGAYGAPNCGYGVAGAYGSVLLPYQAFVIAYRPFGTGIPYVAGYGSSPAGYGQPSRASYADIASSSNAISDSDIYAAIDSVKPAATIIWTNISS